MWTKKNFTKYLSRFHLGCFLEPVTVTNEDLKIPYCIREGGFLRPKLQSLILTCLPPNEPVKTCHKLRSRSQNCDKKTTLESGKGQYKQGNHETGHDAGLGFDVSCLTCQLRKNVHCFLLGNEGNQWARILPLNFFPNVNCQILAIVSFLVLVW